MRYFALMRTTWTSSDNIRNCATLSKLMLELFDEASTQSLKLVPQDELFRVKQILNSDVSISQLFPC